MRTLTDEDVLAIANELAKLLKPSILKSPKQQRHERLYVSQAKAFSMYGRKNVMDWRKSNLLVAHKRANRIEFSVLELNECASKIQQEWQNTKKETV